MLPGASLTPVKSKQITLGTQAKVFLAGVRKGASEQVIKLAVRDAVEAATDFSWLSKGDVVFIKPVNNSGNPYPTTTSPTAIAAMVEILKEVQHIVLMPRCSRHILAGSSLGLKASVGYWRHDTHLEYHRDAATLQEKTAEGNTVKTLSTKQRLVISAADKLLTTYGPGMSPCI